MTEEDKKAIEYFEKDIEKRKQGKNYFVDYEEVILHEQTILNLIQSRQEKIEKNKRLFSIQEKRKLQLLQRKDKEIEKKDKIIDLILEEIAFDYEINSSEDVVTIKRQLKEKFEKKVEDKQC